MPLACLLCLSQHTNIRPPPSSAVVEAQGLSVSLGFYGFLWVSFGFFEFLWATERLDRGTSFSFCSSRPMQTHADPCRPSEASQQRSSGAQAKGAACPGTMREATIYILVAVQPSNQHTPQTPNTYTNTNRQRQSSQPDRETRNATHPVM